MKQINHTFSLLFLFFAACGCSLLISCRSGQHTISTITPAQREAGFTLIIMYDRAVGNKPLLKAIKKYDAKIIYLYKNFHGAAISVSKNHTETEAINYFKKVKGVLSVEKDRQLQLD